MISKGCQYQDIVELCNRCQGVQDAQEGGGSERKGRVGVGGPHGSMFEDEVGMVTVPQCCLLPKKAAGGGGSGKYPHLITLIKSRFIGLHSHTCLQEKEFSTDLGVF